MICRNAALNYKAENVFGTFKSKKISPLKNYMVYYTIIKIWISKITLTQNPYTYAAIANFYHLLLYS